ncbi:hypothetical protein XENTR_v10007658 [Xenopus tropicalis]|uniref:Uncharacterized protein LOC116409678 n=1 Tax=Xenopus tropicalis TaxID=8364 RepID=A0A8J1J962_XENTR|nr:uncharacterized protein LOC116409678 [Xenopus tropicalis]XP_031754408.1 uncharacterized protein LOC116409678 [Xenopus tropicalis]KAE8613291.1 hypothetical protein XENTR_v10007658 [Xenopus tropicalis]
MLRCLLPDRIVDSQWEAVCYAWEILKEPQPLPDEEEEALKIKNLLSKWCAEWEKFRYSMEDLPKSKRKKAEVFMGFYVIAKKTLKLLDHSYTINNQWAQAYKVLEERLQNEQKAHSAKKKELQDSQTEQMRLAGSLDVLKKKVKAMELELDDAKAQQKTLLQSFTDLTKELRTKEEEARHYRSKQMPFMKSTRILVEELRIKVKELDCPMQVEPFRGAAESYKEGIDEVLEIGKKILYELMRHGKDPNRALMFPGETLTHSWYEMETIAGEMGSLTSNNVFEWLYKCEEQMKVEKWTMTDVERLLYRCMEPNKFSALSNMINVGDAPWLKACQQVVNCLRPQTYIIEMFRKDKMWEQESALQFFNRLWMEYQVLKQSDNVSRNDYDYKQKILEGLLPRLKQRVPEQVLLEYSMLQNKVLAAEDSWRTSQEHLYLKKPPLGFPSRNEIWWRLNKYEDPRQTVNWHPYWDVLVRLSQYVDLATINVQRSL